MNSRAYTRDMAWRKALHKRKLDKEVFIHLGSNLTYDNLHQYSKNKIHCSCSLCSAKTRNKGHRRYKIGNYAPSKFYTASDLRKLDKLNYVEDFN